MCEEGLRERESQLTIMNAIITTHPLSISWYSVVAFIIMINLFIIRIN